MNACEDHAKREFNTEDDGEQARWLDRARMTLMMVAVRMIMMSIVGAMVRAEIIFEGSAHSVAPSPCQFKCRNGRNMGSQHGVASWQHDMPDGCQHDVKTMPRSCNRVVNVMYICYQNDANLILKCKHAVDIVLKSCTNYYVQVIDAPYRHDIHTTYKIDTKYIPSLFKTYANDRPPIYT